MKKELALHFLSSLFLFIPISLVRHYFASTVLQTILSFWPFWLGALIGTILPDIDHIIYVYFLRPYEVTSQRINYMAQRGELRQRKKESI